MKTKGLAEETINDIYLAQANNNTNNVFDISKEFVNNVPTS